MASPDLPPTGTPRVKWRLPDIHPEGRKYVLIAGVMAFLAWVFWDFMTWPLLILTVWVAAFFRDPVRVTPQGEGLIVAPADGLVTMIDRVPLPPELAGPHGLGNAPLLRVSIHMSMFDVHLNRTPIGGTIRHVIYVSGKFLNPELDKSSDENERQHIIVEGADGLRVGFTQIAGLVSRRIVAFVKSGDIVVRGQRVGMIRFGSRVDVYLPEGSGCQVALGQRTVAGETILARPGAAPVQGVAQ